MYLDKWFQIAQYDNLRNFLNFAENYHKNFCRYSYIVRTNRYLKKETAVSCF